MTVEQQETLEKYDDCVNEMYGLIELEIFSYAFRLGGGLMLATLMDSVRMPKAEKDHTADYLKPVVWSFCWHRLRTSLINYRCFP